VYIARYKIKQEVKMNKRINYVSQLFITNEFYKVATQENLMPSTTKALLDAIELGVKKANFYDNEIGNIANLTDVVNSTGDELVKAGIVKKGDK
tara:strand:- start:85 stop:366 length:282 start_codon:yes stop_codon:yes gene_type:complete